MKITPDKFEENIRILLKSNLTEMVEISNSQDTPDTLKDAVISSKIFESAKNIMELADQLCSESYQAGYKKNIKQYK